MYTAILYIMHLRNYMPHFIKQAIILYNTTIDYYIIFKNILREVHIYPEQIRK